MLLTKQKNRKQIDNLKMDLEIINPIESKTILGGDWYIELNDVYFQNNYHNYGGWWDNALPDNFNDPGSWGGDDHAGGGGQELSAEDYPGNLSYAELSWLAQHPIHIAEMIHNKNLAEQYGQGQHNGVYDSLRHALWSALDAHDLGAKDAYDFHTLHETEHWDPRESPSDLINNGWGYNWEMSNGNPEDNMDQFLEDFYNAVKNGVISVI